MENNKKYWFFGSKLNTVLLLILIVLMVVALRWMYQDRQKYTGVFGDGMTSKDAEYWDNLNVENPKLNEILGYNGLPLGEEALGNKEVFKNQPGAVESVTGWTLAVDLLTPNPKWIPGVDSSGPFFLNKNQKIRDLKVTNTTIIYPCQPASQNITVYLEGIQKRIDEYNKLNAQQKSGSYVSYYFDIDGNTISGIHEQCLP